MNPEIGFSTFTLSQSGDTLLHKLELLNRIKCNIVELSFLSLDEFYAQEVNKLTKAHLENFKYVSLHAPIFKYGKNKETKKIFSGIETIHKMRPLDFVVFHPCDVLDFDVFKDVNFPIAFENMGKKADSYKRPEDFIKLMRVEQFKMVLDVAHIYTNDSTMGLTAEFYNKFAHKIVEIHMSSYTDGHVPLFQTKTDEIVQSIQNMEKPIIIESILRPYELQKERDYIISILDI